MTVATLVGLQGVLIRDLTFPDRGRLPDAVEDSSETVWAEFQSLRSRFHGPVRLSASASPVRRRPLPNQRQVVDPTVADVMAICRCNDRVCPLPAVWEKMFLHLPVERRGVAVLRAPFPIPRRQWNLVADLLKQERLHEQFIWAHEHGGLFGVQRFLVEMGETEWHHHTPLEWPTLDWGN